MFPSLPPSLKVVVASSPLVTHAMAVRRAVMTHDYVSFFRLYATAPNLGRALMDAAMPKVRGAERSRGWVFSFSDEVDE